MPRLFINNIVYALTLLSFWSPEILECAPKITLGALSQLDSLGGNIPHMFCSLLTFQ